MKRKPSKRTKPKPPVPLLPVSERADYIVLASTPHTSILLSPEGGKSFLAELETHKVVTGEVVTVVSLGKSDRWPILRAKVIGCRIDAAAMGLKPLRLREQDTWDPAKEEWFSNEDWAQPILARGVRTVYALENVVPTRRKNVICEAVEMYASGMAKEASGLMRGLLIKDIRCLDAHAHLGNFTFDDTPEVAIRHYEVGVQVGGLSLGSSFDGVLEWSNLDNRPFLRCLHGYGLCLWRMKRMDEAKAAFERLLWLNPRDNQGARDCRAAVKAGERWVADLDPLVHIALQ